MSRRIRNLYLVTFDLDYTQFLVNADTYNLDSSFDCVKKEAIDLAIKAHIDYANHEFGGFDENPSLSEAMDRDNYSVVNVDMEMLLDIIKRNDWHPRLYGEAIVFS